MGYRDLFGQFNDEGGPIPHGKSPLEHFRDVSREYLQSTGGDFAKNLATAMNEINSLPIVPRDSKMNPAVPDKILGVLIKQFCMPLPGKGGNLSLKINLQAITDGARFFGEFEERLIPLLDGLKERNGMVDGQKITLLVDQEFLRNFAIETSMASVSTLQERSIRAITKLVQEINSRPALFKAPKQLKVPEKGLDALINKYAKATEDKSDGHTHLLLDIKKIDGECTHAGHFESKIMPFLEGLMERGGVLEGRKVHLIVGEADFQLKPDGAPAKLPAPKR